MQMVSGGHSCAMPSSHQLSKSMHWPSPTVHVGPEGGLLLQGISPSLPWHQPWLGHVTTLPSCGAGGGSTGTGGRGGESERGRREGNWKPPSLSFCSARLQQPTHQAVAAGIDARIIVIFSRACTQGTRRGEGQVTGRAREATAHGHIRRTADHSVHGAPSLSGGRAHMARAACRACRASGRPQSRCRWCPPGTAGGRVRRRRM